MKKEKTTQREERRKKVEQLYYKEGKDLNDIVNEIHAQKATIINDIKHIKDIKSNDNEYMQIDWEIFMCQNYDFEDDTQITILKRKFDIYIACCEKHFKNNTLKKEEIEKINIARMFTGIYEHFIFYIRTCIRFGMLKEAKEAINNSVVFEKKQPEIYELGKEIELAEKRYIAIDVLKKGEGVIKAMQISGLSEGVVIKLNKKLNNKKQETNKLEQEK